MNLQSKWADAYLSQSKADLKAARAVQPEEDAVFCMLLQMVFEKVAKAALLRSGQLSIRRATSTHIAASTLVIMLKRRRELLEGIDQGLKTSWNQILPLVQALERAHPAIVRGGGEQLEYPWERLDNNNVKQVMWPSAHLTLAQQVADPKKRNGLLLLRFATQLTDKFNRLF